MERDPGLEPEASTLQGRALPTELIPYDFEGVLFPLLWQPPTHRRPTPAAHHPGLSRLALSYRAWRPWLDSNQRPRVSETRALFP